MDESQNVIRSNNNNTNVDIKLSVHHTCQE
jgi:hypothetical protein